jgi:hypothetical protein
MTLHTATPPTPAVEHLPTIFRRIRTGEYRIPPFQREFVWEEKGAVAELVGIEGGVVSGVSKPCDSGVRAPDWRPRHGEHYHEAGLR